MSSLTIVRRIAARPEIVWDLLTTSGGLSAWMGPDSGPVLISETEPRVGGHYRIRFRMLDGTEHEASGVYEVVDPQRRLVMSWRWAARPGSGLSEIEFQLRAIPEGTELTFTHSGLADDGTRDEHRHGWDGALDKLEGRAKALDRGENT
jgi:uncharacterized protein YndB with AHSA1/START domain